MLVGGARGEEGLSGLRGAAIPGIAATSASKDASHGRPSRRGAVLAALHRGASMARRKSNHLFSLCHSSRRGGSGSAPTAAAIDEER